MKKTYCLFLSLIFAASLSEAVTYYVTPLKESSACPGHPCKTIEYYLNNSEALINQLQKNITMIFLRGEHSVDCLRDRVSLSSPGITLKGEHPETQVRCMHVHFYNFSKLHFKLLQMLEASIIATPPQSRSPHQPRVVTQLLMSLVTVEKGLINVMNIAEVYIRKTSMTDTYLTISGRNLLRDTYVTTTRRPNITISAILNCTFRGGTVAFRNCDAANVTIRDCVLIDNQVLVYKSNVALSGVSKFTGSQFSAILSIMSTITLSENISFVNNSAFRGGAMALYSSTLALSSGANVIFVNNSAQGEGGAIYVDPDFTRNLLLWVASVELPCFYKLLDCRESASYNIYFVNNSATNGGEDVYGASLHTYCRHHNCTLTVNRVPSVSSDPTRVCVCDRDGQPRCTSQSYILMNRRVHPGETMTVPAVVVGGDFGPTVGIVHANFLSSPGYTVPHLRPSQYSQLVSNNKQCTGLNYTLYSNHTWGHIVMHLTVKYTRNTNLPGSYTKYCFESDYCPHTIPVFFNITLLPCPPAFTLQGEPPECVCNPELTVHGVICGIVNRRETISWTGNLWVTVERERVTYCKECPFDYCDTSTKEITTSAKAQCSFNRAGILCGGCKENYSLAIGSSHCIHCPNSNNLALVIFFAAAGLLLVFFIIVLNLTVTQGRINGLIFYGNIVWTYQKLFFPPIPENAALIFLKTFIAWVNLDFGIETCFASGLNAFWKTWLQFIFPLYIWTIAAAIIVTARYSTRLTNLLGNRTVPVLNTLVLLSYMKLLNTAVSSLEFSTLTRIERTRSSKFVVWSLDGNLIYFGYPHLFLSLAGLATLLFLWLPYTLLLLLVQWLRRLSHYWCLKWIAKFHPVYDAYFAPLKDKHQYWFGVLLLARGMLLVTCIGISPTINLLLLFVLATALLLCMTLVRPYKSRMALSLESAYLANLTFLTGFFFFTYTQLNGTMLRAVATGFSTGVAFLQFFGTMLYSVIAPQCSCVGRQVEMEDESSNYATSADSKLEIDNDHSVGLDVKLQPLLTN